MCQSLESCLSTSLARLISPCLRLMRRSHSRCSSQARMEMRVPGTAPGGGQEAALGWGGLAGLSPLGPLGIQWLDTHCVLMRSKLATGAGERSGLGRRVSGRFSGPREQQQGWQGAHAPPQPCAAAAVASAATKRRRRRQRRSRVVMAEPSSFSMTPSPGTLLGVLPEPAQHFLGLAQYYPH